MERDIDRSLLAYLIGKGSRHIEAAVKGNQILPKTVVGVGTYILDIEGDIDLLTARQQKIYATFLKPLLFDVPCQGLTTPADCVGSGLIEPELLGKGYRDDELRCAACREKLAGQAVG
jgi:hypothetical protein